MPTERLFWQDPYLLEFDARVVERISHAEQPAVALDRTAFYPESGGQPWDTGRLQDAAVTAVVEGERGVIVHVLDRPLPEAAELVRGVVNAARREDHRQQHHGQHLLSRAAADRLSARTVSFHLGERTCTIDVDREVSLEGMQAAAEAANAVVWSARPVRVIEMEPDEAQAAGLDPAEQAGERIRVIEVEGFDRNPCGGTHPRSTAEVGLVLVLGVERHKGGTRVEFVCGHRALRETQARFGWLRETAAALQTPAAGVPEAARAVLARLSESDKRSRDLLEAALEGEARRLLAEASASPALVVSRYEGWPAADLRLLAHKLVALRPCVALLGSAADKAHVVFAQSPGLPHDIPVLLKDALTTLGGRGGGRGDIAQGGGERVEALDAALAAAAARIRA